MTLWQRKRSCAMPAARLQRRETDSSRRKIRRNFRNGCNVLKLTGFYQTGLSLAASACETDTRYNIAIFDQLNDSGSSEISRRYHKRPRHGGLAPAAKARI